ncbi:MAG: hypothetical protein GF320_07630 [Armatimonadia bacterium]|nr:hypothetical protein [Armatimonadia bacterium]
MNRERVPLVAWIAACFCTVGCITQGAWWVSRVVLHPVPPAWADLTGWAVSALPAGVGCLLAGVSFCVALRAGDAKTLAVTAWVGCITMMWSGLMLVYALGPI